MWSMNSFFSAPTSAQRLCKIKKQSKFIMNSCSRIQIKAEHEESSCHSPVQNKQEFITWSTEPDWELD